MDEEYDDTDLVAQTADASLRDVELDVFTSFLCSEGFDENDRESLAFMADIVQSETVAFMARSKAKGKGKPVSAKGAHGYRPRATGLTVEDRRRKLHEIKLRSTCKTCGRKGHWSGDRECPGPGKGTGKVAVAHFAQATRVMDKSTQTCDLRGSPRISSSESESFEPEAAANYVSLGRDSETEPAAYMGFFDKGDFEESDEELVDDFASQGAPSTEWDTIEYPEGSDQLFRFGMHKGSTYLEVLRNHPDYYHWGLKEEKPSTMLEAWLVWVYRNFDVPPVGGGGPTLRAATLPVEADTLQKARKAVTLDKAPKSKLGLLRADPKGPCQGGCPEHALNRAGSNAHVMKTTCMLCGHRTSVPRPKLQAKSDPNTCEHKRTDNRNSTRSVHRTFCLDCCTVIEEVPQKLFKQNKGLSDQVLNSPLKVQNLTRRQLEEYTFTKFEAGDVVKRFFKHMDKYLMKADQVTSTELSSFLEDAMDHVVEETRFRMERDRATEASRSSAARSSAEVEPPPVPAFSPVRRARGSTLEPTPASAAALGSSRGSARMAASPPSGKGFGGREKFAGMAIGEKDDPQGDITLDLAAGAAEAAQQGDDPSGDISPKSNASSDSELAAPLEEEIAEPRLPLVDPFEDHDNVWVMLDEGCNQTCRGTKWRRHSEGVLAGYGLQFLQQKAAGTSFKGIGAAKAVGKYSMPSALLISNGTGRRRDIRLQGELASTELDSPDVLCLLSLQHQVQLGLVKDLRKGTAKVSGYSGQLRLARHVRTGLLLLCVSQFGASVTERHRKFAVDTGAVLIPKRTPKRTVSIPARDEHTSIPQGDEGVTAYMLSELVRDKETHHKKVLLVTFGLEKLEYSHRSRKVYSGLTKLINSFPQQKSYSFSLTEKKHEDVLLESLRTNFDDRFRDFTDHQIVFLDCRDMHNPDKDMSTRNHLGTFPKNLYDMIQNVHKKHKWEAFAQEVIPAVHKLIQDQDSSVIFCFCKSGRHRSVANAKLFQEIIKDMYAVETEIVHLSDGPNWKHLCGICDLCSWKDNDAQKQAEDAIDAVTEKWHEYVPKVWIRKDQTQRRLGDDGTVVEEPIPEGTAQASDPCSGATPKSGATAPEPLPKPIPKAPPQFLKDQASAQAASARGSADPPGTAGADPSMGTAGADPSETAQTFTLETDQGNKVAVYDFRPQLSDLDEKELEKACFLVLSRVYSVFSPAKLSEVTSLMAKYTDHVALICAVTHKYLQYDTASALITALVADLRSGARTEKDWHVDLELANRSLDQAILQLDTDAKDTSGDPAGDQTRHGLRAWRWWRRWRQQHRPPAAARQDAIGTSRQVKTRCLALPACSTLSSGTTWRASARTPTNRCG